MNNIVSILDEFGGCHKARGCLEASPDTKIKRQIVYFLSRDNYLDWGAMDSPPSLVIIFSSTHLPHGHITTWIIPVSVHVCVCVGGGLLSLETNNILSVSKLVTIELFLLSDIKFMNTCLFSINFKKTSECSKVLVEQKIMITCKHTLASDKCQDE